MEYGVQIFGCLREFREDPQAFFGKLARMGYRQIEPCVLLGDAARVPEALRELLWKPGEVPGFQALLESFGMTLASCHAFCADLPSAGEEMLALAGKTSIHTYVVNCPGNTIAEDYPAFAEICRKLAERLEVGGASLWLHNGGAEIKAKTRLGGEEVTVLEAVLSLAGDRLGAQIDTGWVLWGGLDPAAFLETLGPRVRSVHFKDMAKGFEALSGNEQFAVLGRGITDISAVFRQIPESGVTVLVDQDASQNGFYADLEASIEALRRVRP